MTLEEIGALPVESMAANDAHLYLWTTNRYLRDAFSVEGPGGTWAQNVEYILFARRGSLKSLQRFDSAWFNWKRTARHSQTWNPQRL